MTGELRDTPPSGEFFIYRTEDGLLRLQVRFDGQTVWLTQAALAELFQTTPQNITLHIRAIYEEGELEEGATCKDHLQVRQEGARQVQRSLKHYNLPMILAVGYRVRSPRGTQFRQWATARLEEFVVKGFTLDDQRLKNPPGPGVPDYFDELLARIRDIRSSEKVFWRKVLDIYATSVDYDPSAEASQRFFATVQNKMHFAAHGHTAAEVIHERADPTRPQMGLRTTGGDRLRLADVGVAKNYLDLEELEALNRIVTAYLEFAELQALNRRPMAMADWITKLDDFLKLSGRDLLTRAGRISHEQALEKARLAYEQYRQAHLDDESRVERDFLETTKGLENQRPHLGSKKRGKG